MDKKPVPTYTGDAKESGGRHLFVRVAAIILFAAFGTVLTAMVLEVQAGVAACIAAEGRWSKAQQSVIFSLYRYATYGNPQDLRQARLTLKIPLGDRAARLALERRPADLAGAYRGFLEGGNTPADVERLIRMYRLFAHAPYFRKTVHLWRQTEAKMLQLPLIANELEQKYSAEGIGGDEVGIYQGRLLDLERQLHRQEREFSKSLFSGARLLRMVLVSLTMCIFLGVVGYAVTLLRRMLRRIRRTETEFGAAFHQAAVGMVKLDCQGRISQANETLAHILAVPREALRNRQLQDFLHPDDLELDSQGRPDWGRMLEPGERRLCRSDGSCRWVRWSASFMTGVGRCKKFVFAVIDDVSEARALVDEIAHQASHDDLTGLINRREIERRLERICLTTQAESGVHALCLIDLDQLKLINDSCGHAAGDRFLRQFAQALASQLRMQDWVGRLGSDEFAVFLADTTLEDAERLAQRIHARLAQSGFHCDERKFSLMCSIGIVEINANRHNVDGLLRAVETACYLAKEEGRNRIRCYRESDEAFVRRQTELDWIAEIQSAMAEDRLLLYAQHIKPLHGADRLQYEVLVRMVDREGRIYGPGYFLPPLERYGQAMLLDRHVLTAVLEMISSDTHHLLSLDLCHINVSAQSIADPLFRQFAAEQLDRYPGVARKICLEITETAVIGNLADACLFIEAMRMRGCCIALDDFGSGLSSFAYLKSLDVDILKIDGAFIRDLEQDNIDLALVQSMGQVGRALGKRTIAEWVENEAAMECLAEAGIDYAQGYAIHQPVPLPHLIRDCKAAAT